MQKFYNAKKIGLVPVVRKKFFQPARAGFFIRRRLPQKNFVTVEAFKVHGVASKALTLDVDKRGAKIL